MVPSVTTGSATAISTTGATINGTAYSFGEVAVVTFDYGQTTAYDSSVAVPNTGNGEVSDVIAGLACGTTYHYRITGQNSAGISNGQDSLFTTTACPPPGSAIISTVAGNGTTGFSGDGGPAISAGFYYPQDVATDGFGNIYIADTHNYRIRKLSIDTGNVSTVAGIGIFGFSGDGILATDSKINGSYGVSADGAGNIYIADTYNNRIRRVDAATGIITTVAGNGAAAFSGDGGPATSASLNNPHKVVLDSAGNIYIADTYNHRIRMVDSSTGIITTVAGNGTAAFAGDGGVATSASFYWPYSVAVDNSGNLYIADYLNLRIRKVEKTTGIISTVAGKSGTGLVTFSGEGGPATSAQISTPYGVTVDIAGNIYIAASYRILKVDAITGILNTVAGNGVGDFSGDGGLATTANLNAPSGIVIDAAGNLIIADTHNHRIRKVVAPDLTITMTAGTGGSISGPATVNYGGSVMYMITPAIGYHVDDVLVDGISAGAVTSHTLTNVAANHTISASFAINSYSVTATAGANGSISGPAAVNYGDSANYSITPATGYHAVDVLVDGASVGAVSSYSFASVTANHTISASFAINSFSITATAGTNGSISGPATVNYGGSVMYMITPAAGYYVTDVLVDGARVGVVSSYTFSNVTANHTISASFAINSYTVVATAGANGSISGPSAVNYGGSASYTIKPANGYQVANVLVDGVSVGTVTSYTFTNVTANHTISASFAALADLTVNSVTGPSNATRGKSISVSTSIKNLGGGAVGSFTVSFYLSKDTGITSGDTLLGTRTVTSLSSGSTTSLSGNFTVPSTIATGKYYVGVIVDSREIIIESSEANNSKAAGIITTVR
jgi:sugar lactone lactonase YvrE